MRPMNNAVEMITATISIIGGSGFIGTRLARLLQQRATAPFIIVDKIISRAFPEKTRIADIRSTDALRASIPNRSVLIHLAAEHRDDVTPRSLYDEVNVQGTRNICTVATEKQASMIVFTSSVAVYGFAPIGTDESGRINPFNDYGRTKFEAEKVLKEWQAEAPAERTLVIIRPTVVFGEQNRGNVYNLLRQIASGRFIMVGDGENRKSVAYVENVAAFLEHATTFEAGVYIFNYIDKPDFSMNTLVGKVKTIMGKSDKIGVRVPYFIGNTLGLCFDAAAAVSGRKFAISSIRVKKFCANSVYDTAVDRTGFFPPVPLSMALERTVRYEFIDSNARDAVFYSE